MNQQSRILLLRAFFGSMIVLFAGSAYHFSVYLSKLDVVFSFRRESWMLVIVIILFSLLSAGGLIFTWTKWRDRFLEFINASLGVIWGSSLISGILLFGSILLYPLLIFGPVGDVFTDFFPRILVYTVLFITAAVSMKGLFRYKRFPIFLVSSAIYFAFIHQIIILLQPISTYPFSISWSETSRYYYASLFFSEKLYGIKIPPSVLHPTRYLMQSIPFLFEGLPLVAHRFWQVILWLVFSTLTSLALVRRLKLVNRWYRHLLIVWVFLYLLVGPIYYHLMVPMALVLWGIRIQNKWRNLIVVLLASVWAGISRLNWFPVPAMLATVLYLMERPLEVKISNSVNPTNDSVAINPITKLRDNYIFRYFAPIVIWIILGIIVAFGTQALYIVWSGNDPGLFSSSLTSNLLWYRLLPNTTYPSGVLTASILFSIPYWILIGLHIRCRRQDNYYLRWLGILVILGVLFMGGLLVSVKIGGGSNLHNMDAYLALLLVVSNYLFWSRFASDSRQSYIQVKIFPWLTGLMILLPLVLLVVNGGPRRKFDPVETSLIKNEIEALVSDTVAQGGEVLFITQRQLAMFDYIPNVPIIPEYEVVFLMEMVMGGNQVYLNQFQSDIAQQRFDLIISDFMPRNKKNRDQAFSEENNIWLKNVSKSLHSTYESVVFYPVVGVEIFAPK